MSKFYSAVHKLVGGILRRLYRIEVIGRENEPSEGPYIVCSNHLSNHDPLILFAAMNSQLRFLAKAELFKIPIVKQFVCALGAYPIKRGASDVAALKKTLSLLNSGEVVGFFPQGHRFPGVHPAETEVQPGVGLIACKAKVKILPVLIETKKFKVKLFRKTYLRIGKPIEFSEFGELQNNKNDYDTVSREIFARICSMTSVPPALSDKEKNGTGKDGRTE